MKFTANAPFCEICVILALRSHSTSFKINIFDNKKGRINVQPIKTLLYLVTVISQYFSINYIKRNLIQHIHLEKNPFKIYLCSIRCK